jgi:hypothetical protein
MYVPLAFYTLIRKKVNNLSTRTIPGRLSSTVNTTGCCNTRPSRWPYKSLHRLSFHHSSSLASGRYQREVPFQNRREVPFQNLINFLSLNQTIFKPTQAPCYDYCNTTISCNNDDVMRFMSPAIQLHHFRVIRLVAFWVQSHKYSFCGTRELHANQTSCATDR